MSKKKKSSTSQSTRLTRREARRLREQKRRQQRYIALGIILLGIILLVGLVWWNNRPKPIELANVSTEQPPGADGMAWGGPEGAAVIIEEYSDFGCPHCGTFALRVAPTLMEKYGDNPNVRFVFKPFPLRPETAPPAEAAACAAEQNLFWPYHDTLFANQGAPDLFGKTNLQAIAQAVGADMKQFNDCLDSGRARQVVNESTQDGRRQGVNATPTFFINGQRVEGARPAEDFIQIIDQALAAAG